MGVSIALIFLVLLCQFQRFRKVAVTMLAMPLSLLGRLPGTWSPWADPFGMTAFLGIIGLLGIVVRNGIILVTYAEELRNKQGLKAKEAALAAGKAAHAAHLSHVDGRGDRRCANDPSRSPLWGPMGTVTCFGLLFAMVLTLSSCRSPTGC